MTSVFEKFFPCKSFNLSIFQRQAIIEFITARSTFASLPTEHGKSLIYQLAIPITKPLSSDKIASMTNEGFVTVM